jgi:hypothetical protein
MISLRMITAGQKEPLALFAVLSLGIIDSLTVGAVSPTRAAKQFFTSKNSQFVKTKLGEKNAVEVMGRGLQLLALCDAIPAEEAHREFQRELRRMKALCHALLDRIVEE